MKHKIDSRAFQEALLAHYAKHGRDLPWRQTQDPYAIWLSEIMLQQTTVATVKPYFIKFLTAFPTVFDLAKAPLHDVLSLWQGLGYYSRARNLHRCAQMVANDYNGTFPATAEGLHKLPGIGPYTAAAVASIAFGEHATVVDGNVLRVVSRLYRVQTPLPQAKKELEALAHGLTSPECPGEYAGAIMDLGATICRPKNPQCDNCPVADFCAARAAGDAATYPRKAPKKQSPEKSGIAYVLYDAKGRIYLQRRPESGLLGGLWEVPHTGWEDTPLPAPITPLLKQGHMQSCAPIRHVFTHFALTLDVRRIDVDASHPGWIAPEELAATPVSTLMRKVLKSAENPQLFLK